MSENRKRSLSRSDRSTSKIPVYENFKPSSEGVGQNVNKNTPTIRNDGEGETPLLFVSSTLQEELKKLAAINDDITGKEPLTDENNNVILEMEDDKDTMLKGDEMVSLLEDIGANVGKGQGVEVEGYEETNLTEEADNITHEQAFTQQEVTLGGVGDFKVLYIGRDMKDNYETIPYYKDTICQSNDIPPQRFIKNASKAVIEKMSSHFYQWSIPETKALNETANKVSTPDIEVQNVEKPPEEVGLNTENTNPSKPFLDDDHQHLGWWEETTENIGEGPSLKDTTALIPSQLTFAPLEQTVEGNAGDFMSDFMRSIIPENLDSQILSSAYEVGADLIIAGLQYASSFIEDEFELEPREDILRYNGYEIQTKGRGVLLLGVHMNCNLASQDARQHRDLSTAVSQGEIIDPSTRIRIIVQLSAPSSIPEPGEHGYHPSEIQHDIILGESVWKYQYGLNFIQVQLPSGVDPRSITTRTHPNGMLLIEAP